MSTRRTFLKSSLACSSLISFSGFVPQVLLHASANTPGQRRDENILVVVQLQGGNDGLNTVIPYGDDQYYKNRFTLAIGKNTVSKINDHIGFHPSLNGFSKLMDANQLNVIQGVGYPNPNRSHFESMDLWHTAHQKAKSIQVGWLGQYVESKADLGLLPAIHLGREEQPLALAAASTAVPSIRSAESFRLQALGNSSVADRLDALTKAKRDHGDSLLGFVHDNTNVALAASQKLESLQTDKTSAVKYPNTTLANKMKTVAELIGSGLKTRIYYVVLDGFDTHSNQAAAHAGLLSELGGAVSSFMGQMKEQGNEDRVAVMAFSEFGRRVRENASRGTDHGTAAPMFVAGGKVKPGVTGDNPDFKNLKEGDLQHQIDYRQVYASVLEDWLGASSEKIVGGKFDKLDLFS